MQCQGTIITRGALHKRNRDGQILLDLMLNNDHKLVRDEAQRQYNIMFPERTQYILSPRPDNISVSKDEFNGTISYSASFSDQDFPENSKLNSLDYDISVNLPVQSYESVPSCLQNGHYLVDNLNLSKARETVDISCAANAEERTPASLEEARNELDSLSDKLTTSFVNGDVKRLTGQTKVENKEISSITYNRSFSHEKAVEDLELNRLDT